jgi:hypothetical protein
VPADAETTIVALLDAAENGSVVVHDADDENISGIPLRSVTVVASHIPFIEDARTTVTAEMENTVLAGLTNLVKSVFLVGWTSTHGPVRTKLCLRHRYKQRTIYVYSRHWFTAWSWTCLQR